MDERLLVKRAKRGDTAAFAELYGTIYKRLYQFALYTLGNTQDAEDVVSAAVMEAFENIGKLRKEDAFSAWMYRIVANMCKQKMREYYQRGEELTEENGSAGRWPAASSNPYSRDHRNDQANPGRLHRRRHPHPGWQGAQGHVPQHPSGRHARPRAPFRGRTGPGRGRQPHR